MPKYTPSDAVASISEAALPNTGEAIDAAIGGFPAIQRSVVQVFIIGQIVIDLVGFNEGGGGASGAGFVEVFDGATWIVAATETLSVGQNEIDIVNTSKAWSVQLVPMTDLSDVDVRVRGTATANSANSSALTDVDISSWYAFLRRRTTPAIV